MSYIPTAKGLVYNMDLFVAQPLVNHSLTIKPLDYKNNGSYATKFRKEGGQSMDNKFIRAGKVAQELSVSKPYAYKLIRQLNEELKAKGFITITGRVNRQYFYCLNYLKP